MSGSDKPQIFPIEKEDERESFIKHGEEEKGNLERADDREKEPEEIKKEEKETDDKASVSHRESEKQMPEDDDDGFKTPTSSDHRIPAIMQCPPAPKKPRLQPSKLKRKASPPPGACRSLQLDASTAEVESIFRPVPSDQDDTTQDQKIKKARTDDKDPS